jgi:YD repeat-containing protein
MQWDGLSRLVRADDDDSSVTLAYDSLSNNVRETLAGLDVLAAFDGVGNEVGLTYPGGRELLRTFDELDRIASITDASTTGTLAAYSYTGPGRLARRDFGNGTRWELEYSGLNNPFGDHGDRVVRRSTHSVLAGGAPIDDRSFTGTRTATRAR